ncbi:MAG TPA: hypothetical protein VGY54_06830, partial [Polyangiaceae bacterium]|nr:hypothetical protein [Polyangiaceae bacterium]
GPESAWVPPLDAPDVLGTPLSGVLMSPLPPLPEDGPPVDELLPDELPLGELPDELAPDGPPPGELVPDELVPDEPPPGEPAPDELPPGELPLEEPPPAGRLA